MSISAKLNNYHQTPRKTRAVSDLIKGKPVNGALDILNLLSKRASAPLTKLIRSAVANSQKDPSDLVIKDVRVDKGIVMKRFMTRARGSSSPIKKRLSHVSVILDFKEVEKIPRVKGKAEIKGNVESRSKKDLE